MNVTRVISINNNANTYSTQNSAAKDTTSFGIKQPTFVNSLYYPAKKLLTKEEIRLLKKNGLNVRRNYVVKQIGIVKSIFNKKLQKLGDITSGGEYGNSLTVLKKVAIDQDNMEIRNITRTVHYNPENPNLMSDIIEHTDDNRFHTHISYNKDGELKSLKIDDPRPLEIDYKALNEPNTISKYWVDKEGIDHTEFYTKGPDGRLTEYIFKSNAN